MGCLKALALQVAVAPAPAILVARVVSNMSSIVEIIIGSASDKEKVSKTTEVLDQFGISYNYVIASAHRSPDFVIEKAKTAKNRGVKVIIAAAGAAAHLAGLIAAYTLLPVIGLPLSGNSLNGLDALLSTVQMPSGVPVATVAIDGSSNAAFLALEILAVHNEEIYSKLIKYRENINESIKSLNNKDD
ncbi:MAG: 5-(carboxyamino)imidazole ribonucleotide mutase [Cyanobacteriota bacterium]